MKKAMFFLSALPALVTGILFSAGTGGGFFHAVWFMPLSGIIAGIRFRPVLIPVHTGICALSMLVSGLLLRETHLLSLGLLFIVIAAVLELIGFGIGLFGKQLFSGRILSRIGSGFALLILLTVLFVPFNAIFGNPVSGLIAKHQLDSCIAANVDMTHYRIDSFGYDWYNGHYRYRMTDTRTDKQENMSLYENKDSIYFSGTNRSYENIWN